MMNNYLRLKLKFIDGLINNGKKEVLDFFIY